MKFSCKLEKIKKGLETVNKLIDPNPTLPVLSNILLKVSGKRLTLIATNLESAVKYSFEVDVKNEGDVTTPARVFVNYINLLQGNTIEIKKTGDDLIIETASGKTKIKGLPVNEFPLLPEVEKKVKFQIKSNEFKKALHETTFVCSNNTTRPVLSGVYFNLNKEDFNIVATDGYRLSERKTELIKKEEVDEFDVIIPGRILNEVEKILEDEKEVECVFGENQVVFKVDGVEFFSRLIKGKFPDYKVIIPKEVKTKVDTKTKEFFSAVKQMSVLARDDNNSLNIEVFQNQLKVSATANQVGEGEVLLEAKTEGDDQKININADFLLAALNILSSSEEIEIHFKDNLSPIVIYPKNDQNFLHLIMPLKS